MNEPLTERLTRSRAVLQRRRWLSALLYNLLTVVALLLLLGLLNRVTPLQEQQAFVLLLPVLFLFLARLAWDSYRAFVVPPTLPQLAAEVEKENPRWMDALICAVEQEERPAGRRRRLEQALIDKMRRETARVDFTEVLMRPQWRIATLAGFGVLLLLLLWPAAGNEYSRKAAHYFGDLMSGAGSGLAVTPGDHDVPIETDARISAEIFRWEDEARVEYVDGRGRHDYRMNAGSNGEHTFAFYGVEEELRYRVVTPSLVSNWYRIRPYVPPSIESLEVTVSPPGYSGEEARSFSRLRDFTTLEGSRIDWELELPEGVDAALVRDGEMDPLGVDSPTRQSLELRLDGDLEGRFYLEDAEGRNAETTAFEITARRDYPPTLDVTRPGGDIDATPDERVGIEANAADDFGLRKIAVTFSVSGERRVTRVLYEAGSELPVTELPREKTVEQVLDLEQLDVSEGDIITYFLTAADNREPEPQVTRSEVFFIEVREDREPEEMEGDPMDQEEIDIRALLVEAKRLIRMSWETASVDGERRERLQDELERSMEALRIETTGIKQEIIELAGTDHLYVVELMRGAIERMGSAGRLIAAERVEDSIAFQEQALAHLLAVENELAQDPIQSEEPSDEAGDPGEVAEGEQPDADEIDEMLDTLRRLIDDIRELADNQGGQNSTLDRLAGTELSPDDQAELRSRQDELTGEARRIRRELNHFPGAREAWNHMDAAAGSMNQSGRQISRERLDRAEREGARARASLLAAGEELEELLQQVTDSEMGRLTQRAEALARDQAEAASASRGLAGEDAPDPEEISGQRERQEQMRRSLDDILSDLDDSALELMDEHPEVAEALSQAGRRMRDENVGGRMDRAANALLYEQPERAAEIQEELAARLQEFAENLHEAGEGLPAVTRQQVAEALQQIREARREVQEMFGEAGEELSARMEEISREIGEGLSDIARGLNDAELEEISASLLESASSGEGRPNPLRLESTLSAANRSLEQRLLSMEVERRERLSRQGSEPPEKYRSLVEEYFRNLSETQ